MSTPFKIYLVFLHTFTFYFVFSTFTLFVANHDLQNKEDLDVIVIKFEYAKRKYKEYLYSLGENSHLTKFWLKRKKLYINKINNYE